jgi:DNA-binding SARP family transcriptional activator
VSAEVEFGLLGPLLVRRGGNALPALPGKQRVLLAALLLRANQTVSLAELSEIAWGPEAPASAIASLRNYVKALRKALAACGESRLGTMPGGYQFRVTADELDLARFEVLASSAQECSAAGAWEEASARLGSALALWRGEPLADVPSEWMALREVPRLAELRLQAVESRIEVDLHLGRREPAIAELRRLTAVHPFRERLHALLMLALYRDGRQAESLAIYHRIRDALVRELAVEPGPELRLLQQQVLRADPELMSAPASGPRLAAGPGVAAASRPAGPAPRQLPAPAPHWAGRTAELRALTEMLGDPDSSRQTVPVCTVTGMAGVGKTAMAVYWAHHVTDRFPDGQLYIDLRGYDPDEPLPARDALAAFIRALGGPSQDIPPEAAERAALYRSLLSGRQVLVLLDNAWSAEQVRPLLPGAPGCAAVVTSRDALAGLVARDGAGRLELNALPMDDAATLLCALIGERATADHEATRALAGHCSCLPLALRVAAELAAARPSAQLADLVSELADQRTRLDQLGAGGDQRTAVRTVLSWSCRHLDAAAERAFRLLSLHPGDFEPYAAAALTGSGVEDARRMLDTLARAYLIQSSTAGHYGMHDLLKAYAAEQAAAHDAEPERRAAVARLLDYYLHTAHAVVRLLNPALDSRRLDPPGPGVVVAPMASRDEAIIWAEAENPALHAAIRQAAAADLGTHAWQLARLLGAVLVRRGYRPESIDVLRTALAAAERAGDEAGQAHTARELGEALVVIGRDQEADTYLQQALRLHQRLGDQVGQARAHHDLSILHEHRGQWRKALGHARQALGLFRAAGHVSGQARALNNVGWYQAHLGQYREALASCQQAIDLHSEIADDRGEGGAWDSLGYTHGCLGNYAEAITCCQRAVDLYQRAGDRYLTAEARVHLGDAHDAAGNVRAARQAWQQAIDVVDELPQPQADAMRSRLSRTVSRTASRGTQTASGPELAGLRTR